MLARLADHLVLRPTRHKIRTVGKRRHLLNFAGGHLELWSHQAEANGIREAEVVVLKFPGTGGRAERASDHPADCWTRVAVEVWAVNPPGYGGSSGRASLRKIAPMAAAAYDHCRRIAAGRPLIVTGNSLGTASALLVAATRAVDGLLLRNPPPISRLIVGRYSGWHLRWGAQLIAGQIPPELDSIANASQCDAPVVFVTSGQDRTVPPAYQQMIFDAYRGQKRQLTVAEAGHACPVASDQQQQYATLLHWLLDRAQQRGHSSALA